MSSAGQGSISVGQKNAPAAAAAKSYHGNTALVSKNGNNATAAAAFIAIAGGVAWDWILPFLTIGGALGSALDSSLIQVDAGTYAESNTLTKNMTINCTKGVILDKFIQSGARVLNITGKPDFNSTANNIAVTYDNGATGSLELGTVIGGAGMFFRGRTGQQIYLTADKIDITQNIFTLNGCLHIGASGANGAKLYANVDYINMNITIAVPGDAGDVCAVYAAGSNCFSFVHSKLITSNTPANGNGSGWFRGVVTARSGASLYVTADKIHNIGLGRAFAVTEANANLYLDCSEIRVTDVNIEAGNLSDNCNVYFKSGCRVVAGTAAAFAITSAGAGVKNVFIDGTVYSNKPLDPAVTLKTGTWIVDVNIV